jgi:phage nucleotide-binding protein
VSILEQVGSIRDFTPKLNLLLYGEPGAGKTVWAADSPKPILIDTEQGSLSLKNHPALGEAQVLVIDKPTDVWELKSELWQGSLEDRETIIIDTLTSLRQSVLDAQMKKVVTQNPNRNENQPSQGEYTENNQILKKLVTELRDLDKHLILVAHDIEEKDERTGATFVRPDLSPRFYSFVKGAVSVMGYMTAKEEGGEIKRYLQVHPTNRVAAKNRLNLEVVDSYTFDGLLSELASD